MKLKTLVSPIRLSLRVLSRRIVTTTLGIRLQTVALSKRLAVAVGDFIKAISLVDTATVTDSLNRTAAKALTDSAVVTEVIGVIPNKRPVDSVGLFDEQVYFAEDYVAGSPQTYTLSRQIFYTLDKPVLDVASAVDTSTFTLQRSFTEGITVTDDVNGVLADDDQVIELVKPVTDQVTALDTNYIMAMTKILADTPLASSSGFLYSQGYTVDMSYFAEDYVGESRVFS